MDDDTTESKSRSHRSHRSASRHEKSRSPKRQSERKAGAVAVGVPAAKSKDDNKKLRSSRRDQQDKEAKGRARTSSRRSQEDHDAKRRGARPSSARSTSPMPGAVASSARSDRASRKATAPGAVSASRKSDRASRKGATPASPTTDRASRKIAGAVPASPGDRASRKERDKSGARGSVAKSVSSNTDRIRQKMLEEDAGKDEQTITLPPLSEAADLGDDEETALVAEAVESDDEENAQAKQLAIENEKLRKQMNQILEERNNEPSEEEPNTPGKAPFCNRYVVAVIVLLLIGGGAAAGVLLSGKDDPVEPASTMTTDSPTLGPTFLATTSAPTEFVASATNPPTTVQLYDPPSVADCAAIVIGEPVKTQQNMSVRNFELLMDVSLTGALELDDSATTEIETKIQENLLPQLVGCPVARRALREKGKNIILERKLASTEFIIGDAKVVTEYEVDGSCDDGAEDPDSCFRVIVRLEIFLKGSEGVYLIGRILEIFGSGPLVELLGLDEAKYQNVLLASVTTLEETGVPSVSPTTVPSKSPTATPSKAPAPAPSKAPTVLETPTDIPSKAPIAVDDPTSAPSKSPTTFPTPTPSSNPTLAPAIGPTTSEPTDLPSSTPSSPPTKTPTMAPSIAFSGTPTMNPTLAGSGVPTTTPSISPSTVPSRAPSSVPSRTPSFLPSQNPSEVPSARPSSVPSSAPSTSEPSSSPTVAPVNLVTSSAIFSESSYRTTNSGTRPLSAFRANDGAYNYGSCFRSYSGAGQWWRVDLGITGIVTSVEVWNYNSNNDVWPWIEGSLLELLDSDGNIISTTILDLGATKEPRDKTYYFPGGVENVASVKITKTKSEGDLYVCEVKVSGYVQ